MLICLQIFIFKPVIHVLLFLVLIFLCGVNPFFFSAPDCEEVEFDKTIGTIDFYSLVVENEYIFVQKSTDDFTSFHVSYMRRPFRKAYFPTNLTPLVSNVVFWLEILNLFFYLAICLALSVEHLICSQRIMGMIPKLGVFDTLSYCQLSLIQSKL